MAVFKYVLTICIFSFLSLVSYQSQAADNCANVDKKKYTKIGDFDSSAGERIIFFKKLRDDLVSALEKGDAIVSQCLYDLYDKSSQEEAGFWAGKAAAEGCDLESPTSCPDPETPRSLRFLETLHKELETKLKTSLADMPKPDDTEAQAACDTCLTEADDQAALAEMQGAICCGTKDATDPAELGVVRSHYAGISYNQCLAKTDKKQQKEGLLAGGASCIWESVKSVFKGMFDGVKAFFSLPGDLIAARAQIWAIITDSDFRNQFMQHLSDSIMEFIGVQGGELTSCLNDNAKRDYYCQNAGEVIGFLASPAIIGNIFKIAKLGVKAAASAMKGILASSSKGASILAKLNKATGAAGKVKSVVRKKAATAVLVASMTAKTSKMAQLILKMGSPFTKGIKGAYKILAPVARVSGKVLALPSQVTDKAIIAGFNAGKKVVANMTAKKGGQVITTATAGTATVEVSVADAAAGAATAQSPGVQVLPRVNPSPANPTGNPYVGTPARNLRVNLTGTNSQIARVEQQLASNPSDVVLLQRQADLQAKKQLLDEALAPKAPPPQPLDAVRDGSKPLFQGAPREAATSPQVRAAERNLKTRSQRGGEAEVASYVTKEKERLNGLLSKYESELNAVKGEAAEARPAMERAIQSKIKSARQQLDALDQAQRNLQYRRWEAQEAGQ